jgi:kinetochore protein NNF1
MPSAAPDPRSPSPPPAPPTQLTPGPRAQAFLTLYNSALDSTLKAISYPSFADCFPSIATNAPTQLSAMHTGMVNGLRGFAVNEFDTILEERRVVENLNRLEDLIADAKKRKARSVEGEGEGESGVLIPYV